MQARGGGEIAHAILDRAALGVGGAVIEAADAGERDRRRAHGAGFERHIEVAVDEPFRAHRLGGAADCDDFRMGGRIAIGKRAIAGLGEQVAVAHDHAADRHLAGLCRRARLCQRKIHEAPRSGFGHRRFT